jgi:hypothetical protein
MTMSTLTLTRDLRESGQSVSTVYVVCVLQGGSSEEQVLRSEWSAEEKADAEGGGERREKR